MSRSCISVMGSFVADLTFRTRKIPAIGETVLGESFNIGPGGKGSNQAVGIARLGVSVGFICKLGTDAFGDLARSTYKTEGVITDHCFDAPGESTGAAAIVVDDLHGTNSIVVVPGSGFHLTPEDVERARPFISQSSIFITQLEVPVPTVEHALNLARTLGIPTILNPAPAVNLPEHIYQYCDYFTPNEVEAAMLVGHPVSNEEEMERAADELLSRGVKNVVITLGNKGAFAKNAAMAGHIPAIDAGPVVDTTGAGDAFNAGFAVALSEGKDLLESTHYGCAVAGISVTRHGTSQSMPYREEVNALLNANPGKS